MAFELPKEASRRSENRTGLAQDLIRPLKLAIHPLERLEALPLIGGETGPLLGT